MPQTDTAKVMSNYKRRFAVRRCVATFFGGIQCCALSCTSYIFQPLLFLLPCATGIVLSILSDPTYFSTELLPIWLFAVINGGFNILLLIIVQIWSGCTRFKSRSHRIQPIGAPSPVQAFKSDAYGDAAPAPSKIPVLEDENYDEDEDIVPCCSATGANLVAPKRGSLLAWLLHIIAAFAIGAGAVFMLVPSRVSALYGSVYILFLIIGWYNLGAAQYALGVAQPLDPNADRSVDFSGVAVLTRAGYLIGVYLINFLNVDIQIQSLSLANYGLQIFSLTFPVLWQFGLLSSPDTFICWALEQMLIHAHGGPAAGSYLRLFGMILLAWAGTAGVSIHIYLYIIL